MERAETDWIDRFIEPPRIRAAAVAVDLQEATGATWNSCSYCFATRSAARTAGADLDNEDIFEPSPRTNFRKRPVGSKHPATAVCMPGATSATCCVKRQVSEQSCHRRLVPAPKHGQKTPARVTWMRTAWRKLLDIPGDTPIVDRDRAILELLYSSGLRLCRTGRPQSG